MNSKAAGAFGDYELDERSMLAMRAKKDRSIIPVLWNEVYRLVVGTCSRYWERNPGAKARCELDDLIQESYLFFETAIEKYEPDRGAKFTTYLMFHIDRACISATGGFTKKQRNDPVFTSESLDAPIKDGEDTTLGEIIPDEESESGFADVQESEAVRVILEQVKKVPGDMNKYCFLEYAYHNCKMSEIARKIRVSQTAIKNHIEYAAYELRNNPVIRNTYPERYEKKQYYIPDYETKGVQSFFSSRASIVEDIVNRRITLEKRFEKKQTEENQDETTTKEKPLSENS